MSCRKNIEMEYFQGRLLVEIVWPLLLFIILFLVRLRGLKKYHHECQYKDEFELFHIRIHFRLFRGEGDALCWVPPICPELHLHLQQHMSQYSLDRTRTSSAVQPVIVSTRPSLTTWSNWLNLFLALRSLSEIWKIHWWKTSTLKRKSLPLKMLFKTFCFSENFPQHFNPILTHS